MKPAPILAAPTSGTTICCDVLAYGSVQATPDELPALRRRPGPGIGETLPLSVLKHADEQTVAALAAVLRAIDQFQLAETRFTDWGVVAAPCFLGRSTLVTSLRRFAAEGAWGMSPHFIPHRTQHAVAGTISQALKIHGPNFGAGGGAGSMLEALLASSVLLEGNRLPGVWAVVTAWEPELIPDANGQPLADTVCRAVALALVAARPAGQTPRLRVLPGVNGQQPGPKASPHLPTASNLEILLSAVPNPDTPPTTVIWPLAGGGWLELSGARRARVASGE